MPYGLVETRRRTAARAALYGSLLVVGAATYGAIGFFQRSLTRAHETDWAGVAWESAPAVRLLQQYVRIDSNTVDGDELAAAIFLATPLEAAGIPVRVERLGERHANLWAVLEGEERDALVLHSHLDVEPVPDASVWPKPPFAGVLEGPWMFGRGTFDMKSYGIAQLFAFLRLQVESPHPRRSVVLLATAGEERGSDLGMRWVLREHPELVERFWAMLTEGGVLEARSGDSLKYWGTEIAQKRYVTLLACAPERERLERLRQDVHDVGYQPTGLTLLPEIADLWATYGPTRDSSELRELMRDPERLLRDPARYERLPSFLQAMLRNELVPFPPEPAPGGGWQMKLILQLLPGADATRVREELLPSWITGGVHVAELPAVPPHAFSPTDHPLFAAVADQLGADHGRVPRGPFFLVATATDARFLRALGVPSYGFTPFPIFSTDTMRVDNVGERIGVPGFHRGVVTYERLVARLAG
jgi:acetylornithine deacetylase/succinyl-diaminopimelate desuccinylase-like protein